MNHTSNPKALYVQSPFGCWRQWRVCLRFEPEVVFCGPGFTKCWHVRCCWLSLLVVVHARFSSGAGRGCGGTLQSTGEGGLKQNARKLKYRKTNAHFPTEVILYPHIAKILPFCFGNWFGRNARSSRPQKWNEDLIMQQMFFHCSQKQA